MVVILNAGFGAKGWHSFQTISYKYSGKVSPNYLMLINH